MGRGGDQNNKNETHLSWQGGHGGGGGGTSTCRLGRLALKEERVGSARERKQTAGS